MNLHDIVTRTPPAAFSIHGGKIPWNDEAFSKRMLENHLSQQHDWASRRLSIINKQVAYIAAHIPQNGNILDLGCGPGLYINQLATLGYACTGVDFSPASIAYAKEQVRLHGHTAQYVLEDMRTYVPTKQYDAVLLTFGELNVFCAQDANNIIAKAAQSLNTGGKLFIEVHVYDEVKRQGKEPAFWQSFTTGLFLPSPHLCLQESYWNEKEASATTRYIIVDAVTAQVSEYASSMMAYTLPQYRELFTKNGFTKIQPLSNDQWPVGDHFEGKLAAFMCQKGM